MIVGYFIDTLWTYLYYFLLFSSLLTETSFLQLGINCHFFIISKKHRAPCCFFLHTPLLLLVGN